MSLIRLFPVDTRAVELASSGALIFTSLLFMVGSYSGAKFTNFHQPEFWAIITLCFGCLHFAAIYEEHLEHLRAVLSWVAGSFWVWAALDTMGEIIRPSEIATLFLGICNFYAFVVNALLVKKQLWK
jgi:hypothetical protein